MVGDGGSAKYDPIVETQVVELLALSNRVAVIASVEAAQYARRHGRPRPHELSKFQALAEIIRRQIKDSGLEQKLDVAREQVHRLRGLLGSRRQLSAIDRRSAGEIVFKGSRLSLERKQQFENLLQEDEEYQVSGRRNPYRPRGLSDALWGEFHMTHHGGAVSVRRAASQYQRKPPVTLPRRVSWDKRDWQAGSMLRAQHSTWIEVHPELDTIRQQCTEGSGFWDGAEIVQCKRCFEIVAPKRIHGEWSSSWQHVCPSTDAAVGTRDHCSRTRLHFGFELYRYPELDAALPDLARYDLIDSLLGIIHRRHVLPEFLVKWIPKKFDWTVNAPPIIVAPGSSPMWVDERDRPCALPDSRGSRRARRPPSHRQDEHAGGREGHAGDRQARRDVLPQVRLRPVPLQDRPEPYPAHMQYWG